MNFLKQHLIFDRKRGQCEHWCHKAGLMVIDLKSTFSHELSYK